VPIRKGLRLPKTAEHAPRAHEDHRKDQQNRDSAVAAYEPAATPAVMLGKQARDRRRLAVQAQQLVGLATQLPFDPSESLASVHLPVTLEST
jgi:hypothetical protein